MSRPLLVLEPTSRQDEITNTKTQRDAVKSTRIHVCGSAAQNISQFGAPRSRPARIFEFQITQECKDERKCCANFASRASLPTSHIHLLISRISCLLPATRQEYYISGQARAALQTQIAEILQDAARIDNAISRCAEKRSWVANRRIRVEMKALAIITRRRFPLSIA